MQAWLQDLSSKQRRWEAATELRPSPRVAWLKKDFELGHGHAMAIVALLKVSKNGKQQMTGYRPPNKALQPTGRKIPRSAQALGAAGG